VSIVSNPASAYVCFGASYNLVCIANTPATARTTYQWFRDGMMLNGRTGNFMTLNISDYSSGGVYSCAVTAQDTIGTTGSTTVFSQGATVVVVRETQITNHPTSVSAAKGGTAMLSIGVEAVGAPQEYVPGYQWMKRTWNATSLIYVDTPINDDGRIYGSQSSILTITDVRESDTTGLYICQVTGFCKGTVTSRVARVFMPAVTVANMTPNLCQGGTLSLSCDNNVTSLPEGTATCQWYKGSTKLTNAAGVTGANSNVLSIKNVTTAAAGEYSCVVTYGATNLRVASNPVTVTVGAEPTIVRSPETTTACEGNVMTMSAVATGEGLKFQWMKGAEVLVGETGATLSKIVTTDDAGFYSVVISNLCGTKTSRIAELNVEPLPAIESQPNDVAFTEGAPISFTVMAKGRNIYQYQWYLNGVAIDGATKQTLTIANAKRSDEGQYYCELTNLCGSVKSRVATASSVMGITDDVVSGGYVMSIARPNPTTDVATINYTLPVSEMVRAVIADLTGRELATVSNEMVAAGTNAVSFSASDLNLTPGVYSVTLSAGTFTATQQVVVVK
ncbi:MAG: T9SS type A sorting domain-containing protein, partial [Candidatus Kapabacteria bacterium]|nr:T9SS type A sorting domain-containing protein [Candidatus Kapabacteria bacterium]